MGLWLCRAVGTEAEITALVLAVVHWRASLKAEVCPCGDLTGSGMDLAGPGIGLAWVWHGFGVPRSQWTLAWTQIWPGSGLVLKCLGPMARPTCRFHKPQQGVKGEAA